jgi:hypothetical protein
MGFYYIWGEKEDGSGCVRKGISVVTVGGKEDKRDEVDKRVNQSDRSV